MSTNLLRRPLWFEGLEARRVLAAGVWLSEGVLHIEGSHKSDVVLVSVVGGDKLGVLLNKSVHLFDLDQVTELNINAGAGNDKVVLANNVELLAIVYGGKGNDWLKGGGGRNEFFGEQGNDHLVGSAGDDVLVGGAGNDKLWGLGGQDQLEGGAGHDQLDGGEGDDLLIGDAGHDKIRGGAGLDEIWGGTGNDHLSGGEGNDILHGENGKDKLCGGLGDDQLFGEGGNDHLQGNEGNDWLDGGDGKDHLLGGHGDDSIKGGAGNDHLDGGSGNNLLDGDGGRNKLKNGTQVDLDQPPLPPDPPEVVEYITYIQSEGGVQAQLVYTNDGNEELLVVYINNASHYSELSVTIGGFDLGLVQINDGTGYAVFSTLANDPEERSLPGSFQFVDGAAVQIGPELHGNLNLTEV